MTIGFLWSAPISIRALKETATVLHLLQVLTTMAQEWLLSLRWFGLCRNTNSREPLFLWQFRHAAKLAQRDPVSRNEERRRVALDALRRLRAALAECIEHRLSQA